MTKKNHLFLIDGSGYIFRAYYALPPLYRKSDGLPTGAVNGFCNMIYKLVEDTNRDVKPSHIAVIFDSARKTFRNDIYKDYKANRGEPPEDLIPQFQIIKDSVKAFGIQSIELSGFEADDIIATYARIGNEKGWKVSIVSSDKPKATEILTSVGNSLLAIDCPGLAIEIIDEAMECAIEVGLNDELELLAETLLLANTALTIKQQSQYEGLRLLLDDLNTISKEVAEEFESKISDIDEKAESLSKPLDETWKEWQDASKLVPTNSSLTVVRIDEDDNGRALIISHHPDIGSIGLWLPDGGIEAAPGNTIEIHGSRIKVAPPTKEFQESHNIRGIVAVENPEAISFIAKANEILDDEDENEISTNQ